MQSFSLLSRPGAIVAIAAAFLLPLGSPLAALADGDATSGVGVARVSDLSGTVAIQRGDTEAPTAAVINAPVLGADYVTTGDDGRAEVQFDGRSMVRLGHNVQLRVTRLDDTAREMQLAEGTVEVRLFGGADGTQIDTPSISIRPETAGAYRVTVDSDGVTNVTVRSGRADIVTPSGTNPLTPGSTVTARGQASDPQVTTSDAIAYDEFDSFNASRDSGIQVALEHNDYVSPEAAGVEDLSEYGRWVDDASYGQVWVPSNVSAGWAPYRDGQWVWEGAFGWTWVAAEPWGWAPYHYGSWYHSPQYGWAWYPPAVAERPVWRPALVAFFTFGGGGGGLSVGFGNVGWVPLAPFEPYRPWYGNHVTIVNNTTIVNNYANISHFRNVQYGAVSAVSSQRFTEGNFRSVVAVSRENLRDVNVVRGALPLTPTAANLRYSPRAVSSAAVRPVFAQRTFAGSNTIAERTPFATQRTQVDRAVTSASNANRPVNSPWNRFGNGSTAGAAVQRPVAPVNGYSRQPSTANTGYARPATTNQSSAWNRFSGENAQRVNPQTQRSYAQPQRSYQQAAPQRSYQQAAPQRSYQQSAPQRSYQQSASQRSYQQSAPQRSYQQAAPQRSYQQQRAPQARPSASSHDRHQGG